MAERDGEGVHDPGQGRTLLRDPDEDLARTAVVVLADRDKALAVSHPELKGEGASAPRQLATDRLGQGCCDVRDGRRRLRHGPVAGGQGLGDLAVVAVDGHRLEAQAPRLQVELLDVVHAGRLGHVAGLGDGT